MNSELLEEIKNKYRVKYSKENIDTFRIYQLDLIGRLRTKYYTLKESKDPELRKSASCYLDHKINHFFYIFTRSRRKLTAKELSYLTEFFCNAPSV
jgi:hypothetical protein